MAAMSPSGCLSVVLNARATPEDMLKAYFQCVVFWEKVRLGVTAVVGVGVDFGDGEVVLVVAVRVCWRVATWRVVAAASIAPAPRIPLSSLTSCMNPTGGIVGEG